MNKDFGVNVQIKENGDGTSKVYIEGKDVSKGVHSVEMVKRPGIPTQVTLHIWAKDVEVEGANVERITR